MNTKNEFSSSVPGNWLQVDFHVHSPCSNDFIGIGKDDSGYIWLLEQAKSSTLDIIVITDHNDIAGYLKLLEIENDLLRTKRTLERTNSPIPESVSYQITLFSKIIILPGVELDIYPNIHLIIIFDPQKIDEISTFLTNAGYSPDVRGEETSARLCKWNLDQTLTEADKANAIAIAAHVDSDKGLYEVSKKWGQNRISAFCNDKLYAMEFINPKSRDQIENILKSPDYYRNSRMAYVQSSDFHGKPEQKIGERRTYVRMDDIDTHDKNKVFSALKKALRNPDEFISAPGRPELQAILRKLDDKPSIENIQSQDEKNRLIKYICAYANTEDGTIVIGRNESGNWVGQKDIDEKHFIASINSLINSSITPQPHVALQVYPYYGNNFIASVRVRKHHQLCSLNNDDKIYLVKSREPKAATSKEIIDIAESRFIERYAHLSITTRLSEMSQKLLGTEDSIDILPIVRKIDNNSIPLKTIFESPKFGSVIDYELFESIEIDGNGLVDGNIIFSSKTKPRYENHYLRTTAPTFKCSKEIEKRFSEDAKFSGEKIIIVPGGGVYYDDHENMIIVSDVYPPMVINQINNDFVVGYKFVIAYLKSSIAIWYAERCLGSFDIRRPLIQNLPIPINISKSVNEETVKIIDELLSAEKKFLNAEKDLLMKYNSREARESDEFTNLRDELVNTHNLSASVLNGKIDNIFYEVFGLSENDVYIIEQVLKSSELAIFRDNLNSH